MTTTPAYSELYLKDAQENIAWAFEYGFLGLGFSLEGFVQKWLSILLENRTFSLIPIQQEAKNYILGNYKINYSAYNLIVGYRANDSYFTFASNFLNNEITLSQLESAMKLGELGIKVVLKSQRVFNEIKFLQAYQAESGIYHKKFSNRDNIARQTYKANPRKT